MVAHRTRSWSRRAASTERRLGGSIYSDSYLHTPVRRTVRNVRQEEVRAARCGVYAKSVSRLSLSKGAYANAVRTRGR